LFRYLQGTWAFQSLRLSKRRKDNDAQLVHGRLDDLESFYHVLFWVSLRHARHALNPVDFNDYLDNIFDHPLVYGDKTYSSITKSLHMTSTLMLEEAEFQNPPLRNLLLGFHVAFKVLYNPPPKLNKIGPPAKRAQRAEDSYKVELEIYEEELRFLNSDNDSNWMEVDFENALQSPVDEWGLTGYISNTTGANVNTKWKYTGMISSNIRYN